MLHQETFEADTLHQQKNQSNMNISPDHLNNISSVSFYLSPGSQDKYIFQKTEETLCPDVVDPTHLRLSKENKHPKLYRTQVWPDVKTAIDRPTGR